ncbi:MAG: NTPase KAP [Rhizobiales bacterium]|nr:NTPase KAP [Hyphomicrobiales bacterium]
MTTVENEAHVGYIIDQETRVDLLRNEAIAATVVELITAGHEHAITVGVHGDWGAGKSSVLHMVEAAFEKDGSAHHDSRLCIRFNGWEFQGFEDAKIALIEGVVTQLVAERSLMTTAKEEVANVWKRIDWLKVAKRAGGLAFNAATGLPSPDQITALLGTLQAKIEDPSTFLTKENGEAALAELKEVWKEKPDSKKVPEELRQFQKAFQELIKKAGVTRLVVLVDDLDRCLPETAIQTLEAIRLFVSLPKTAFVIGADEAMIEYAVRRHFKDLPETGPSKGYPKAYLEKLIQVPFRIPAMGETETRIYVTMLLVGTLAGEDSPGFIKLLDVAKDRMSRPWLRETIEDADVKAALGAEYVPAIARAVAMADRISAVLARGANGNPRQVKRFVNALNLRLRISRARGFGTAIDPDVLAKLMLVEMYHPDVFEHVALSAAAAQDGKSPALRALEEAARRGGAPDPSDAGDEPAAEDGSDAAAPDSLLESWLTREDIHRWANVDPAIGALELTPYLFVVNDRRSYVGKGRPLSAQLRGLLEKLSGSSYSAASVKEEIKGLDLGDVETLFVSLRSALLVEKDLQQRPGCTHGLGVIVETHPGFQLRLVETLGELPVGNLGAWAASAFDSVVVSGTAKERFAAIRDRWRKDGSTRLGRALSLTAEAAD